MSIVKKTVFLLTALTGACIAAPVEPTEEVSVTTQAIEARATPQSFILSPIPLPEALDEAGKNSSNWFPNQTYMNFQGAITANITEAARFIFIGADDQKLELVVENNRSLTFGVDAALFNKAVLQFFQPIQNNQNQLESRENNFQLAEAECQEICNRTSGSTQCLKCKGESQVTQGFSFLASDSDLSYYPPALSIKSREDADNSLKAGDFPCAPEATMCYSDHHCISEWLGIRCNMKCGGPYKIGNIYKPGEQYGHVTGCYYTQYGRTWIHCTCFETPVRSVNEEPEAISQPETSSSIDDDFVAVAARGENAQPYLDFEPGTFLTWTNEKFVVVENDIVMSSPVAGFCVEGMGQPGFQVNVVSPVADEDIYKSCIEVGLSPTFI